MTAACDLPEELDLAADVLLLLVELDRPSRVEEACALLRRVSCPTLVLTSAEPGPAWGAALGAGASLVASASTTVDDLERALDEVHQGTVAAPSGECRALIDAWSAEQAGHERLRMRVDSLSPREGEVLHSLSEGVPVGEIAEAADVAVSTVRSHVRSLLAKLGVSSQLGAVADLARLRSLGDEPFRHDVRSAAPGRRTGPAHARRPGDGRRRGASWPKGPAR